MSSYSPEALTEQLLRVQNRRAQLAGENPNSPLARRDYRQGAANFNSFAPKQMDTKILNTEFSDQIARIVGDTSTQATAASGVMAQNRFNWEQHKAELARLREAKRNAIEANKEKIKKPKPLTIPNSNAGNGVPEQQNNYTTADEYYGTGNGGPATGSGSSYYTQTPKWLDINAGLTTFQAGGRSWTLNASVAPRFKKFINALVATGYKIKSAGSYADRNQANGSGTRSLHSYGLAIDINAFAAGNSYNPGNAGQHYTNMPKGVSALAAKYGLVWGGDWKNSKDYMHFSVPYAGTLRQGASKPPRRNPNKGRSVQSWLD